MGRRFYPIFQWGPCPPYTHVNLLCEYPPVASVPPPGARSDSSAFSTLPQRQRTQAQRHSQRRCLSTIPSSLSTLR